MNNFTLLSPSALLLLILLIPIRFSLRAATRSRLQIQAQLGGPAPQTCSHWRTLLALILLICGLARPGYNPSPRGVSQGGRDLVFALDVSRSMLARDAKPSRLEKAKADIKSCLAQNPATRVGLVVFAGSATVKAPLTMDHDFIRLAVESVGPSSVPQGSTFLQAAFEKIGDRLLDDKRQGYQDVILLTDGEDQGSQVATAAALLAERGVRLLVLGYGDTSIGARIPLPQEDGSLAYVTEEGQDVWTRLNESGLSATAAAFQDGLYVPATRSHIDLATVYRDWTSQAPLQPVTIASDLVYHELYPYLLGLAALLLLPLSFQRRLHASALVLTGSLVCAASAPIPDWQVRFQEAAAHMEQEQFTEANEQLTQLVDAPLTATELAACLYQQALCCAHLSDATEPAIARLEWAQQGLTAAARSLLLVPRQPQTQQLLQALVTRRELAEKAYQQEQQRQQDIEEALAAIIEALRKVIPPQAALAREGQALLPRRTRGKPSQPALPVPADFSARQQTITTATIPIRDDLQAIRQKLAQALQKSQGLPPDLPVPTELDLPADLVNQGHSQQQWAIDQLTNSKPLQGAVTAQQQARKHLQAALDALEGNTSNANEGELGEDQEWDDDYDQDWDLSDSDSQGSQSAQMASGPNRTDYVNRALPNPDYSIQDLLEAERENNLKRAQKHAAQAGKTEKNW